MAESGVVGITSFVAMFAMFASICLISPETFIGAKPMIPLRTHDRQLATNAMTCSTTVLLYQKNPFIVFLAGKPYDRASVAEQTVITFAILGPGCSENLQ